MPDYHENEWPLEICKVKEAWDLPLPDHGHGKSKGEGIVIAHPDTGWTLHPELIKGDRYIRDRKISKNFFGKLSKFLVAKDELDGPSQSHGTTTASLMLSEEGHPNDPIFYFPDYNVSLRHFVSGIAPKVEVIPLRVTNFVVLSISYDNQVEGFEGLVNTYNSLAAAIFYVLSLKTELVGVISISLGGPFEPKILENAIKKSRQEGVIICAAAGQIPNFRASILSDIDVVVFPARSIHTVCVAGCNRNLEPKMTKDGLTFKVGFYGPSVDITTPGYGVMVARTDKNSEDFIVHESDGTSYSTALTAGACALWQAYHGRSFLIKKYGRPFLLDVFKYCLGNSSDKPAGWDDLNRGTGILNVEALLKVPLPTVEQAEHLARLNQWDESDWGDPNDWGRETS